MSKLEQAARPSQQAVAAMQLALEALEMYNEHGAILRPLVTTQALREALAESEALSKQTEMNLNCKSVQKRLATSWGYVKAEQYECKECGAKQAQIDRLMLEYCPDEMTSEQMREWGNNQRPSEQADQRSDSERIEPVAWGMTNETGEVLDCIPHKYKITQPCTVDFDLPLYAAPVRTKDPCNPLQDLTDDEIAAVWRKADSVRASKELFDFLLPKNLVIARAVIAADREKNK